MSWKIDNGCVGSAPYSELCRVYYKATSWYSHGASKEALCSGSVNGSLGEFRCR